MNRGVAPLHAEIIDFLVAHGAREIEHPGGTLLDHLERTARTLSTWGAAVDLVHAGLCHAAYGTDGFARELVPHDQRDHLISLIGVRAERIVYQYAGCDRGILYPQLGVRHPVRARNRFTGDTDALPDDELANLVELTFANELDVLGHNAELATQHSPGLAELFARCEHIASPSAFRAFTFSPFSAEKGQGTE